MASDRSTPPAEPAKTGEFSVQAEWLKVWAPVVLLAVVTFGYAFSKLEPPAPKHLKIASGGSTGAYFQFAGGYAEILKQHGYELEVLETQGSVDNLERLLAGEVDLAIVQGGVANSQDHAGVEALTALFFEPIWIFHRADSAFERISDLEGTRIAIGSEGSGTRVAALELLADNGIRTEQAELLPSGGDGAAEALLNGEIDAAIFVTNSAAQYIRLLLADERVTLMPIRRHRAYRIRHPFLSSVVLGEGVVDLDENLPPRDVPLVAAAASLVASKDLHHALVPLLIQAAEQVHGSGGMFKEPGYFPSHRHLDLPVNEEAAHFLENGLSFIYNLLPYRTAVSVDRLKILLLPFIPLLLIVFKMAPPLYRWRIRSKIYRWYEDLRELDHLLLADPSKEEVDRALEVVSRLELEVTEVSVPLSYMDEFYNLRVHIELIEKKLAELCGAEET